jgi:RNA polymerase sigma-70 factor (ECF subfamily)
MNPKEYNECVSAYSDAVYRFIVSNLRDDNDAQDIVQNAFEVLWRNHAKVEANKAKSYLFTVAYRDMIDIIRKHKRKVKLDESHENIAEHNQTFSGALQIVTYYIKALPDVQQHVLMLRDYEGYDYKEIGDITRLSESQVKVYIFRARQALKNLIVKKEHVI